jgi:hypothetical protein
MVSCQAHANELLAWEHAAGVPFEGAARVLRHAFFAQAAHALAANMLEIIEHDRGLGSICRDAGRYVAATAALQLHFSNRLTLARLKEVCTATRFLSPGRARDVLRALRELGYIAPGEDSPGSSVRGFVATSRFLTVWREHLQAALRAACIIEPAAARAGEMLDRPEGAAMFIQLQGEGLLRSAPLSDQHSPLVRVLLHHDGGNLIVWQLLAAGDGTDAFPTTRAAQLSLAGISRRFGISRVQLRRLLRAAARDGVLTLRERARERRSAIFATACHEELRFLYAFQLAQLLASAAGTVRRIGDTGSSSL